MKQPLAKLKGRGKFTFSPTDKVTKKELHDMINKAYPKKIQ